MDDRSYLLLALAMLYLVEGVTWIPTGSVVFLPRVSRCRKNISKGDIFPTPQGGFSLLGFLPSDVGCISQPWPISLSPWGAYAYVATSLDEYRRPDHTGAFSGWNSVQLVKADGCDIVVDGKPFARTSSDGTASLIVGVMKRMSAATEGQRAELICSVLRESVSLSAVRHRLAHLKRAMRLPLFVSFVMWILAFVVGPLLLYAPAANFYTGMMGWLVVSLFLLSWMLGIIAYRRALRTLQKVSPPGAICDRTWTLLLSPASAMRAADHLARGCLADFHPVCVAFVVCPLPEFRAFAKQAIRDARQPMLPVCSSTEPQLQETEAWFREQALAALFKSFAGVGVQLEDFLAEPHRCADARSYCPRCESQYVMAEGLCQTCGGLQLEPFAAS